jgi:hypothetical protein
MGVARVAAEPFTIGAPISTTFLYGNTGRDPARLSISTHAILVSPDDWTNGRAVGQIHEMARWVFRQSENEFDPPTRSSVAKTIMAFPTSWGYPYAWYFKTQLVVDGDIITGRKEVVMLGCFLYMSFNTMRHTSFCGIDLAGENVSTTFNLCQVGNDAN